MSLVVHARSAHAAPIDELLLPAAGRGRQQCAVQQHDGKQEGARYAGSSAAASPHARAPTKTMKSDNTPLMCSTCDAAAMYPLYMHASAPALFAAPLPCNVHAQSVPALPIVCAIDCSEGCSASTKAGWALASTITMAWWCWGHRCVYVFHRQEVEGRWHCYC